MDATAATIFGILILGTLIYIAAELRNVSGHLWKIWLIVKDIKGQTDKLGTHEYKGKVTEFDV